MSKHMSTLRVVVLALLTVGLASGQPALGIGSQSGSSKRWVIGKGAVLDARAETVSLRIETPDDVHVGQQLDVFRLVPASNGGLRLGGLRFERKRVAHLEIVEIDAVQAHTRIVDGKPKKGDAVRLHGSGARKSPLRA